MPRNDRDSDLERKRGEYEGGRLVRDVVSIPAAGIVGLIVGGPGAAAVAGVVAGAKAIADKVRRDREWEGR